jgi:hypothetical protein
LTKAVSATVTRSTVYTGPAVRPYCDCPNIASNDKPINDSDINDATLARVSTEAEHRRLVGPCGMTRGGIRRIEVTSQGDQPIRALKKGTERRPCRIGQWSASAYSYSLKQLDRSLGRSCGGVCGETQSGGRSPMKNMLNRPALAAIERVLQNHSAPRLLLTRP